jgi:hypothetical protein
MDIDVVNATLQPLGATAIHLNFIDENDAPVDAVGSNWKAESNCLNNGLAEISAPVTADDQISFNYTTRGCTGEDTIIFTTPDFESTSFSTTVTIEDTVSYISWVSSEPSSIAIAGSGGTEKSTVTFRLNGSYGEAVAGQTVNFRIEGSAGDTIRLVDPTAISDSEGIVRATVLAGSMPNVVTVIARHEASGNEAPSGGLVVATGSPSDGHFDIALSVRTINAWNRLNSPTTEVTVAATDRVGNPVVDGTVINFVSPDGGSIPPSCITENNTCTVEWKPDGRDPANGRARVMATVKGTENFIDTNGNNVFDDDDIFNASFDLGEPYIDQNNSDIYEPGDYFVDTNRNGSRDEGDEVWNGLNCQHSSLCSDTVRYVDLSAETIVYMSNGANVTICEAGDFAAPPTIAPEAAAFIGGLYLSDGNNAAENPGWPCATGNSLPAGTEISFSAEGGTLQTKSSWTVGDEEYLPNGAFGVRFKAGSEPTAALIKLNVAVPGEEEVEFYWDITVE